MAEHVLAVCAPLPTAVVCDDADVAAWARAHGARVVWEPGRGLNRAVQEGVAQLRDAGARRVIVAHGDLPLAGAVAWVARFAGVTLVPDRFDDGTNVACVPTDAGFRFAYGPGSFRRHGAEARRLGLGLRVVREPLLGYDVDWPADLLPAAATSALSLDLRRPARALAVGAHPDDVEFGCGGTLAKWAAAGTTITHLSAPTGRRARGTPTSPWTSSSPPARRSSAPRRARSAAPGDVVFLGYVDGELQAGVDERRELRGLDPHAAARRGARPRPLAPLPPAPRPPPCRLPRDRRHRGRARPALLPRPRTRAAPTVVVAALGGRRARTTSRTSPRSSSASCRRCSPTAASSARRITSTIPPTKRRCSASGSASPIGPSSTANATASVIGERFRLHHRPVAGTARPRTRTRGPQGPSSSLVTPVAALSASWPLPSAWPACDWWSCGPAPSASRVPASWSSCGPLPSASRVPASWWSCAWRGCLPLRGRLALLGASCGPVPSLALAAFRFGRLPRSGLPGRRLLGRGPSSWSSASSLPSWLLMLFFSTMRIPALSSALSGGLAGLLRRRLLGRRLLGGLLGRALGRAFESESDFSVELAENFMAFEALIATG